MKVLVTGACGFIGSHVLRYFVKKYPDYQFVNYDKLTYAGNPENVADFEDAKNYKFIEGDVCDMEKLRDVMQGVDAVLHLAAESHVDNSLGNSLIFTKSNTFGTHVLLEVARSVKVKKFVHVSTDEVYGDIVQGSFKEDSPLLPTNPYAASKAAAEMIVQSYKKTYNMPIIITRGNNVYGPNQYPEKIIPRFITSLIDGEKMPLHGTGMNVRTYIHVDDVCTAIDCIFMKGVPGEIYNIGTSDEISNLDIAKKLLAIFDLGEDMIEFVQDRPFNDKRYSVNIEKLRSLGWKKSIEFDDGLTSTVKWYVDHPEWWKPLKTGSVVKDTKNVVLD